MNVSLGLMQIFIDTPLQLNYALQHYTQGSTKKESNPRHYYPVQQQGHYRLFSLFLAHIGSSLLQTDFCGLKMEVINTIKCVF